jgi:hypothetical protein
MNAEITGVSHNLYWCCNFISCSAFNSNEILSEFLISLKTLIGMRAAYRIMKLLGETVM